MPETKPVEPQAPVEKKEVPSFSKVAEETAAARSAELATLAGVKPESKTESKPDDKKPEFDFEAEWGKLPDEFRSGITDRFNTAYNRELGEKYGDIIPLVAATNNNPNLRETLVAAAKDPELLELLGNPKAREMLKDLTQSELRDFLFGEAKATYQKYVTAKPAKAEEGDPRDKRINELETRFAERELAEESNRYLGSRRDEARALLTAFPALKDNLKLVEHVISIAEDRFESAALRKGIKTRNADGSVRNAYLAEAVRAGVKPLSYREAYEYLAEIEGRTPPAAAPATSPANTPGAMQAPRDSVEGKKRGLELLKSKGGFKGLADASRRK